MSSSKSKNESKLPPLANFCISGTSAAIAKTIAAPIERIKILLQSQQVMSNLDIKYKGNLDCLFRVYKEQGFFSFWRGNLANVVRFVPMFALSYTLKEFFKKNIKKSDNKTKNVAINFLCGSFAGVASILFTYPLDFARTRLAVDVKNKGEKREYKGMIDCIRKNYQLEGIRGICAGFYMNIIANFFYRGFLFGIHDSMPETGIILQTILSWATTSFAITIILPVDTVKRRLMVQVGIPTEEKPYKGAIDCIKKMMQKEGYKGFFKGGYANILKSFGTALTLIFNDYIIAFYSRLLNIK